MPVDIETTPLWLDARVPAYGRLDTDLDVDVLVVGGGITGVTAAYLIASAGRRVALIERDRLAHVDTGHTTAHLTMVTDNTMTDLVSHFGRDHARAVWDAGLAAMRHIDEARRREKIACDFAWVPGYLHAGSQEHASSRPDFFRQEAALAAELGFDAAFVDEVPLVGGAGVRFEDQARFHPGKYIAGLAVAVVACGGQIFEHSAAEEFEQGAVRVNGHTVRYGDVVLATHTPLTGNKGLFSAMVFQTKLALYTSYAVAALVKKGSAPDALIWDTDDPYRYYRLEPQADRDIVIYGGEDHKTGQTDDPAGHFERLERGLATLLPAAEIVRRWSGQVIETPDGLPYIGETADHQFAATGFSGNGMTFGTLGAIMAADYVLGVKNPWRDLLSPGRTIVRGGIWDYIKENADYPYYLVRDRFAGARSRTLRGVSRGHGKVVEYNGEQVAAFRASDGGLHTCSAICTHMGCLVDWNDAESTWDCPCHGSRFTTAGKVVAGPAESPLEPVKR